MPQHSRPTRALCRVWETVLLEGLLLYPAVRHGVVRTDPILRRDRPWEEWPLLVGVQWRKIRMWAIGNTPIGMHRA